VTESNFDRIAEVYDESLPGHVVDHYLEKRTAFVLEHCPRGSALDVGCGTGALAARLAAQGYEVVGLDPSEGMLRVLEERTSRVRPVRGSGTSIPFEDSSFDLVLSVATMHHIAAPADVRRTLAEMVRVTSPGGRILVWDHNPRNPYWRLLMARVPQDTGEERLVGVQELVDGLTAAGAQPTLVTQLGLVPDFAPPRLMGAAAAAERAVEKIPILRRICAHNVMLASKRSRGPG
jgi:SAM-dependent methyltransferase